MDISLFYHQSMWHLLLKDMLAFFSPSGQRSEIIVYLGTSQGDHITLRLFENDADKIQGTVDSLMAYIRTNTSPDPEQLFPSRDFFMNYPNNSVQLNKVRVKTDVGDNDLRFILSQTILFALRDEEINSERLFTLIIYLQTAIFKAAYPDMTLAGPVADALLYWLTDQPYARHSIDQISDLKNITELVFNDNHLIIDEIVNSIYANEGDPSDLSWLYQWIGICQMKMTADFVQSFSKFNRMIFEHTGLCADVITPITIRLIFRAFKSYLDKPDLF
jgi:hypothetical protein